MSIDDIHSQPNGHVLGTGADSQNESGGGDSMSLMPLSSQGGESGVIPVDKKSPSTITSYTTCTSKEDSGVASKTRAQLRQMHETLYETVTDLTVEPLSKDEPDVKAFFKVLKNHRLQSKLVYVLTVVSIVSISHFVLTVRWILPYYYTITTPTLLLLRLIMYWKLKYQYFMLDFCYFANIFWLVYIWAAPDHEQMFAVGFAIANGPLIWALLVFRNSLVFHSLDKVTSLYIHVLPSLLSYVIRWYPDETSAHWYKPFPHAELGFSFMWLSLVPILFGILHQVLYIIMILVVLQPSEDYLHLYRYVMRKETSILYRICNLLGPRFRTVLYIGWCISLMFVMLLFNLLWYNFFIAHCVVLVVFIVLAIGNGATYYIDVFSFENKSSMTKADSLREDLPEKAMNGKSPMKLYSTVVMCTPNGQGVVNHTVQ